MEGDKMKILLDEKELSLLLRSKEKFIGKVVTVDTLISSISLLISVIFASYESVLGENGRYLKIFFIGLGIIFTVKSFVDIHKSKKNKYTYEDLIQDINEINKITHNHSIVIVEDKFNKHSNRILVYEDRRWGCKLFLNYKQNENNEKFIIDHLSRELKIDRDNVKLKYVAQEIHKKYSPSNNKEKIYDHKFYLAEINEFPDFLKQDRFTIDGRDYFWETIYNLEADKDVAEKNSDVVSYVKQYF